MISTKIIYIIFSIMVYIHGTIRLFGEKFYFLRDEKKQKLDETINNNINQLPCIYTTQKKKKKTSSGSHHKLNSINYRE